MRKKHSKLQTISEVLNTSSETFMLIALVSLFALPFVVFSNLEPAVKSAEAEAQKVGMTRVAPPPMKENDDLVARMPEYEQVDLSSRKSENVLGAETVEPTPLDKPVDIVESKENFNKFAKVDSEALEKSYTFNVEASDAYGKVEVFRIRNSSSTKHTYRLEVKNTLAKSSNTKKYVIVDGKQYQLGSAAMPKTLSLEPGKEVVFELMSQVKLNNLSIKVTLAE